MAALREQLDVVAELVVVSLVGLVLHDACQSESPALILWQTAVTVLF